MRLWEKMQSTARLRQVRRQRHGNSDRKLHEYPQARAAAAPLGRGAASRQTRPAAPPAPRRAGPGPRRAPRAAPCHWRRTAWCKKGLIRVRVWSGRQHRMVDRYSPKGQNAPPCSCRAQTGDVLRARRHRDWCAQDASDRWRGREHSSSIRKLVSFAQVTSNVRMAQLMAFSNDTCQCAVCLRQAWRLKVGEHRISSLRKQISLAQSDQRLRAWRASPQKKRSGSSALSTTGSSSVLLPALGLK